MEQSCLAGGYLFVGPEGVGKKMTAKTLAKAVNCQELTSDSCDSCVSCVKIENNRHPDVHIIEEGGAEIKIEYIRQLQKDISLKPYEAKTKVFIIDNAHRFTAEASNATLKILEEPPDNSLIILITDKPSRLFKTIISRCKILKFSPIKREGLALLLKKDYGLDNNTSHFLAYFSEGRLGRAMRLKDTDILIDKNRIIDKLALAHKLDLDNLAIKEREDVRGYLNILASWFRDIYLIKIGLPHSEIINFDRKDDLLRMTSRFSFLDLNAILDSISNCFLFLEQNINTKLLLYNLGVQLWKG
jgi:DNA polymerase-3 subunit delta'